MSKIRERFTKRTIRIFASSMAVLTASAAIFAGCGSASSKGKNMDDLYAVDEAYSEEGSYEESADIASETMDSVAGTASVNTDLGNTDSGNTNMAKAEDYDTDRKLVVTWDISVETEKYDELIPQIESSIAECGGYIEYQNEYSYDTFRYAYFTIRIPEEAADEWISETGEISTLKSKSKNVEDVTLSYVDTESRLRALKTEQDALLAILEKAESVEDIITVQSELSNVNYQIESYESTLRSLKNKVNYTTVNLDINEVKREVPVETSVGDEIKEKFFTSLDEIKDFTRGLIVGFFGNILIIVLWAAIIVAAVLIAKRLSKKLSKKLSGKMSGKLSGEVVEDKEVSEATDTGRKEK
ncbi:MAG: DUF4349 domain-containing protein [Lachnospiraceae bacterium]|nr:DUF4349 domain-containing protein [Lachnospiraceae bacterium]